MNTIVKVSVAGALVLGGAVSANAANFNPPSSGSSDLILFAEVLSGTNVVASYAGDTGVSINTVFSGASGTNTYLGSDANLTKLFNADASGDTLVWAVQAGQFTGAAVTGTANQAEFITTTGNGTGTLANDTTTNLTVWGDIGTDLAVVATNAGGTASVEGTAAATAGVWDSNTVSGLSGWYANGPGTGNTYAPGATATGLYSVTGGGAKASKNITYASIGTANLTTAGLVISGAGTAVPLPAAVWLLGSGLLGLAGVGRRKTLKV